MATLSLTRELDRYGKVQPCPPNTPFSIEDPHSVWIVRSGVLDIFLVTTREGELYGARHHVTRVAEGSAIFGLGRHLQDAALVASAAPATTVLLLSLDQFLGRPLSRASQDSPIELLEEWITSLNRALSNDMVRDAFLTLEPGKTIEIPEEPKAVVPGEEICWISHIRGSSRYLGDPGLPEVAGETFFPVTRHGWLQSAGGTELFCADTATVWESQGMEASLQEFHRISIARLGVSRRNDESRERRRVHARKTADTSLLHLSLLRLASPVLKTQELRESEETCRDPLFLACEAVGKELNIKIKPHPDMLRGIRPADPLASIARASAIRIRSVALKGEWWTRDNGPLLGFQENDGRPFALLPRNSHSYNCYDPVANTTTLVSREVALTLNPFAFVLYRPFPLKALSAFDVLRFGLLGCKREVVSIFLMGMAAGLLGIVTPLAVGIIFDRLIPGSERSQLVGMAVFLVIIAASTSLFTFARSFAQLRLEGKLDAAIQSALWDRLLGLPVSFFRDYSSGDLAQRSLGIAAIRHILTGPTLTAILSGIFSIFSFALLFYYSRQLALLATGLVLCACMVSLACGVLQVRKQRMLSVLSGTLSSLLLQFITGIAKFRVSGTERRAFAVWAREFSRSQQISIKARGITNALTVFNSVFPVAALLFIFVYHQYLVSRGGSELTTGDFLAFLAAFIQFLMAALLLSSAIVSALNVVPVYERAKPIFRTLPEVTEAKASPGKLTGMIEITRVTFRYKADTPLVLRDVSLRIQPGQFVAVVGPSGCGKSTLFRMLLGFETPESGAIYFDGQDLAGLDIQAVRRQIGVVLQTSRPVDGSIYHNIIGSAPLSVEDAWQAARLAGLAADIERMPMGMHTHLADGGSSLSGGQRQRLMIARAIVSRPRILLFDEATSALDNHTQEIVSRSLESLQATRIVIAHRLSTIIRADNIFVMDRGVVVDSGTYQELVAKPGIFQDLAKRQMT